MPRLVRRAPLSERIQAYLNPWDFLLWLSEELNSNDWDEFQRAYALPIGVGMNIAFIIAKSNSGGPAIYGDYDVFGDYGSRKGSGWLVWLTKTIVLILTAASLLNAFYTFYRKRHYRLFEQAVNAPPSTPSARRVRVDSSPIASSPLRFLSNIIYTTTAQSRAHPDSARDVWELAVWDPNPLCLGLFCLFSPGHILIYYLFLPVAPLDARPSVTVFTTIILAILLSVQLSLLRSYFSQQSKDSALIHKEVLNEYDTKFVHPSLQRPSRDVGIQTPPKRRESRDSNTGTTEVDTYTPTIVINRGFRTNPNPSYASQYDPDNLLSKPEPRHVPRSTTTPSFRTPANGYFPPASASASTNELSSLIRPSRTPGNIRQPQFRPLDIGSGDGGSLGVYSHAASPLRKAASTNFLRDDGSIERSRDTSPRKRDGSPLKRMSTPGGTGEGRSTGAAPDRFAQYNGLGVGRRESGRA
ncbi:hypothetical protein K432DRAFT_424573 [Lepidopterella palustris CBS 459.81]|uniref:Meiotically up-regulated gene 154 protein n=1 Tax=Lepidopterella palustris CBS 459.81 TaxID=1314670 RepID=A0A8E2EDF0_9PEZI|nr:hypothetical protein K432DRAFT_424573 [Lepidopterella palustris CBS 459.81]